MKIVIISDIHDNLANLQKCLVWCAKNKIEKIICCGDITNSETLRYLAENFFGEIFLVAGNAELYDADETVRFKNLIYGGEKAIWEIGSFRVGVCHEPFLINQISAPLLAKEGSGEGFSPLLTKEGLGEVDIIFYGHTHKPWIEKRGTVQIVNPGTLGGVFSRATFAFWETDSGRLELKLLSEID
jgi:uncharacterized protein